MDRFDVHVKGSGAVGLSLALALARQGLKVAITSVPLPRGDADAAGVRTDGRTDVRKDGRKDVRAFALNVASRALLMDLKVWPALATDAVTAVHDMRVAGDGSDAGAATPAGAAYTVGGGSAGNWAGGSAGGGARDSAGLIEFSAWQQSVEALAWIVDAAELESALETALRFAPHLQQVDEAVDAALTVWADGKASAAHAAPGMQLERSDYGQTALAARVVSDCAHNHTARQWFRSPDVLALLPFDRPLVGQSFALVWSLPGAQAERMQHLPDSDFEAELNDATDRAAGRLRLAGARAAWPLSLASAYPLCGPGWALVGDAAHVVHPLAGQGLNLGLADVASLAGVIAQREPWRRLGDERLLRRYVRQRALPTQAMARLTDGLLHLFASPLPWVRAMRNHGMDLLNHLAPIKRALAARALDA